MDILKEAKQNFDYLVRLRRHLHENPEVTGNELETLKFITAELDALGIPHVEVR